MEKVRVLLGLIESLRVWRGRVAALRLHGGYVQVIGDVKIRACTSNHSELLMPNEIRDIVGSCIMPSMNVDAVLAAFDRAIASYEDELRRERESISPETRELMRELLGDQAAKTETIGGG